MVTNQVYTNCLRIHRIRLGVRLGYSAEERLQQQPVEVDVSFFFPALGEPSHKDEGDFICYDKISRALEAACKEREFRLIEYLAMELYHIIRQRVADEVRISIRLTKCQIPVAFVQGGASFTYSDLPPFSWVPPL